ncbi:hypothetical protein ABVT39_027908 [Epinephelus coioides]
MALSRLSPNRISQNTPVTAETCAPSQSGAATETNYHQQSSRRRVHGARASPSPYKVAETGRQINGVVSVCLLAERWSVTMETRGRRAAANCGSVS